MKGCLFIYFHLRKRTRKIVPDGIIYLYDGNEGAIAPILVTPCSPAQSNLTNLSDAHDKLSIFIFFTFPQAHLISYVENITWCKPM